MSAPESTVWPIEPHTEAKHRILKECWNGWLPIIAQSSLKATYFEGFAGPGIYAGGEPGSPIVAIEAALNHHLRKKFESKQVAFYLVEKNHERAERLRAEVDARRSLMPGAWWAHVAEGEFVGTLQPTLDDFEHRGSSLAPTFAFLDPFGFGGLPMSLVTRILSYKRCDLLITLDVRDINRFKDSEFHAEAVDECLGDTTWRNEFPEEPDERRSYLLRTYEREICRRVPEAHLRSFAISGDQGLIYYLVGATKHREGMRVIKRAMWKADPTGQYQFSDRTAGVTTLLQWLEDPARIGDAADAVFARFAGSTAAVESIEDFVLFDTPYQYRAAIIERLETENKVRAFANTGSKGGLKPWTLVTFSARTTKSR